MRTILVAAGAVAAVLTLSHPVSSATAPSDAAVGSRLNLSRPKAGRSRPLVVVVAENKGAEITDFVVPYGVLKDAGVADVQSLSTGAGAVQLRRSLKILADHSLGEFDALEPAGADIVVVPAQIAPKDAALSAWVRAQAAKGATIISVCEGARVLANAGLLKGKTAVTHWSAMAPLAKAYPQTTWIRDRRYVQDGQVISTAGVSASIPMSLALVEAIGGHAVAQTTAARLGVKSWGPDHRTEDYRLQRGETSAVLRTIAAFWRHETVEFPVSDGVDEVALALRMDAWGRSYQTTALTTRAGRGVVRSAHGLMIVPDSEPRVGRLVLAQGSAPSAAQLDRALVEIENRYGPLAARMASLGMEYAPPARLASLREVQP